MERRHSFEPLRHAGRAPRVEFVHQRYVRVEGSAVSKTDAPIVSALLGTRPDVDPVPAGEGDSSQTIVNHVAGGPVLFRWGKLPLSARAAAFY